MNWLDSIDEAFSIVRWDDPRLLGSSSDSNTSPFVLVFRNAGVSGLPDFVNATITVSGKHPLVVISERNVLPISHSPVNRNGLRVCWQSNAHVDGRNRLCSQVGLIVQPLLDVPNALIQNLCICGQVWAPTVGTSVRCHLVSLGVCKRQSRHWYAAIRLAACYQWSGYDVSVNQHAWAGASSPNCSFTWMSINIAHIRFRKAWKRQGHSVYVAQFQLGRHWLLTDRVLSRMLQR